MDEKIPRRRDYLNLRPQARRVVAELGEGKEWAMEFTCPATPESERLWTQIKRALRMAATEDRARHPDQPRYKLHIDPQLISGPPKMIRMVVTKQDPLIINEVTPTNVG